MWSIVGALELHSDPELYSDKSSNKVVRALGRALMHYSALVFWSSYLLCSSLEPDSISDESSDGPRVLCFTLLWSSDSVSDGCSDGCSDRCSAPELW